MRSGHSDKSPICVVISSGPGVFYLAITFSLPKSSKVEFYCGAGGRGACLFSAPSLENCVRFSQLPCQYVIVLSKRSSANETICALKLTQHQKQHENCASKTIVGPLSSQPL